MLITNMFSMAYITDFIIDVVQVNFCYERKLKTYANCPVPNHQVFNPFPNKPLFLRVRSTSLLKTVGKGEIVPNEQYLLFPQHFLLLRELSTIFIKFKIVVCNLVQF